MSAASLKRRGSKTMAKPLARSDVATASREAATALTADEANRAFTSWRSARSESPLSDRDRAVMERPLRDHPGGFETKSGKDSDADSDVPAMFRGSATTYAFGFIKDMDRSFAQFDRIFSVLWSWFITPLRFVWTWLLHQPFVGKAVRWLTVNLKDTITFLWRQAVSWWWRVFKKFWHFLCWVFYSCHKLTCDLYTLWCKYWWLIAKLCITVGLCALAATFTLSMSEQGGWHPWLVALAQWSQYGCVRLTALLVVVLAWPILMPVLIIIVGFEEREILWLAIRVPLEALENLFIHLLEAAHELVMNRLVADVYHTAHIIASNGFWPVVRVFFALAGWALFLLMLAWVAMFDVGAFFIGCTYTLVVWMISSIYSLLGVLPQQQAMPEWREVRKSVQQWWGTQKPSMFKDE